MCAPDIAIVGAIQMLVCCSEKISMSISKEMQVMGVRARINKGGMCQASEEMQYYPAVLPVLLSTCPRTDFSLAALL